MKTHHQLRCLVHVALPILLLSFLTFKTIIAGQTHYNYEPMENKWHENEENHGIITLQEQNDDDRKSSECAYYCTARDSKFE